MCTVDLHHCTAHDCIRAREGRASFVVVRRVRRVQRAGDAPSNLQQSAAACLAHNTTGNPGMATGGSGDVLTGIITALIGQKLSPFDAAVLGAHVHGLAGDLAAKELGQVSMIASDLIAYLPWAFVSLSR